LLQAAVVLPAVVGLIYQHHNGGAGGAKKPAPKGNWVLGGFFLGGPGVVEQHGGQARPL